MNATIQNDSIAEKLEALIGLLMVPKVPANRELWDSAQCAAYLRIKKEKFLRDIACKRTFPKARNIDPDTINATNKRWIAAEVMAWAEAQRIA